MEKVIRRTILASNQAKRKARIKAAKDRHDEIMNIFREKVSLQRSLLDEAAEERKNRREDWMRGPLAPRRDFGSRHGVYGSVPTTRLQTPKVLTEQRIKYITVAPGDRVCMVRGRDKGKIGKVVNVDTESEVVTVEGINIYDVEFPAFALSGENDNRPYRPYPIPVPINDVRLVVPLETTDGTVKDVVVKNAYGGAPFLDRPYGSTTPRHTRYISGMDVEIPWPEVEAPDHKDEPEDTLRIEVESRTYIPSLQSFPMPETLIDELRNKYSSFRSRHEPEYLAKKKEEDAYQAWLKSRSLRTPKVEYLQKKAEKTAKEREALKNEDGSYMLSKDTSDFIEKFMASKLQGPPPTGSPSP